ncbi:hypothetical protein Tco_1469795, partial [Tanacetum coccineum]
CTAVVYIPKPPTDDSVPKLLKDTIIKFTMKNGKTPLFFDFKNFCQTTGLDYNDGKYVAMPQTEVVKAELLKLSLHNDKNGAKTTAVLVLGGNKSSTDQLNLIQQMIAFTLLIEMKIDIREIIFNNLVTRLTDMPRKKYVSYPRFISYVLEHLLSLDYTQDATLGSTPSVLRPRGFRSTPKETKGKKKTNTKKSTLVQSTLNLTKKKEPPGATDT